MTITSNKLSQSKDIQGSRLHDSEMIKSEESLKLGRPIDGQVGTSASLTGSAPNVVVTGLTGMSSLSECRRFLTLEGADDGYNNGTFQITQYLSSNSVIIYNELFSGPDVNNGSIVWIERQSYSAEDDHNYHRTDREDIKGVSYYDPIPQYYRCTDQVTPINVNLANIAGKTTDAKAFVDNLRFYNLSVNAGDSFITLSSAGNLKHADSIDITGVPIIDGYDTGNYDGAFVAILSDGYSVELTDSGGNRIYGLTREGSSSSPDSVEIQFMSVGLGEDVSLGTAYSWESSQPATINVIIGYRTCLNNLSEISFRKLLLSGILFGGQGSGSSTELESPNGIGQLLYSIDGSTFKAAQPVTSNQGWLVNNQGILIVNEVYSQSE